jgi:hypothetical protein
MSDSSLDDLRNLPEALGAVSRGPNAEASVNALFGSPEHLLAIYNAAVNFSRLVSVCSTCGGTGQCTNLSKYKETDPCGPRSCGNDCPDCVEGLVVSPEAVERAAEGLLVWELRVTLRHNWTEEGIDHIERALAHRALRAAFGLADRKDER